MASRKKKSGIHIKPSHKGLLDKDLGIKPGHLIPIKTLEKEKHSSNPKIRKRATFALNAKTKFHHKRKKS